MKYHNVFLSAKNFKFDLFVYLDPICRRIHAQKLVVSPNDPTISLEHLREAKITGFPSSMYHKSLVQLMITGAPALEKMTVELIKDPMSKGQNGSEDPGFNMPSKGQWAPPVVGRSLRHGNVTIYEWEAEVKREEDREDLDSLALSRL